MELLNKEKKCNNCGNKIYGPCLKKTTTSLKLLGEKGKNILALRYDRKVKVCLT